MAAASDITDQEAVAMIGKRLGQSDGGSYLHRRY
jgi:hypothetical protein